MNRNVMELIMERLTIADVLKQYHKIGSKGRTSCPIHCGTDHNFSYNDRVYYCFVCGAKGNIITLAKELFQTDCDGAVRRLNHDFHLGLPVDRKMTLREKHEMSKRQKEMAYIDQLRNQAQETYEVVYQTLWSLWDCADEAIRTLKPITEDDMNTPNPSYLLALKCRPKLEFMIDELL